MSLAERIWKRPSQRPRGRVTPPGGEPFELVLLRNLNEEFVLDPGLDVLFVEGLDLPQPEIVFLLSIAPDGILSRELIADVLAEFEGPPEGPELDFLFSLLPEFDQEPGLVLFAGDSRFDEFEQNLLFQFGDEAGEVRREDVELAIKAFGGGGGGTPPELDLLFLLLSDFDLDPTLEFLPIAALAEQFDPTTIDFLEEVARQDGEISRADLEEAIAQIDGSGGPPAPTELDLILSLLEEFDLNPELQAIPVDERFDEFQRDFLNDISADSGQVTRPDLEAALAGIEGPGIPNLEQAAGRVAEIDLASGIVRLEGAIVAITDATVFLDGPTGSPIDPTAFAPGDDVVVYAVWDHVARPIAQEVVLNGEIPAHSTALWLQFGEFGVAPNGQQVLRELTGEYQLSDQTVAFAGPDFGDFDPAQLQPGDFVVMQTQGTESGFEILEIFVEVEQPPEDVFDINATLFNLDSQRYEVRFATEPVILSTFTQFLGANGSPVPTSELVFGEVVLIELDLQSDTALAVRQLNPDEPVPFPDNPDIIAFEVSFAGIDGDVLTAFDPYPTSVAIDAAIVDDETGTEQAFADAIAAAGEQMRFRLRRGLPGDTVGDLIVEIGLNPGELPDEPVERPVPSEIFGEWEGVAVVGEIDLETLTLTKAGVRLRRRPDTAILDRSGNQVGAGALVVGEKIRVTGRATPDPQLIVALEVIVDPEEPLGELPFSTFETSILRIAGEEIVTAAGSYWIAEDVSVFAGPTGIDLELGQLNPGDRVRYVIVHTDVGDFVQSLERDPVVDEPVDEFWEGEYPILSIDPVTGVLLVAGPPLRTFEATVAFDAMGNQIPLGALEPRTPVVIEQVPSAGGAPLALRVDVENPELDFDRPNLVFALFMGVEGDQLITAEFAPKFLALGAEIVDIAGHPITAAQIPPGSNIRLRILHPPAELYSPLGDIVVAMAVGAEAPPVGEPGVPGFEERRGTVVDFDVDAGVVTLDGIGVVMLDETEIFDGPTGEGLAPSELQEGDDLAVHVWWTVEGDAVARAVVRDGEHPDGVPTLWIEFGGFGELDDGTLILIESGIEYALAFEVIAVAGPDRLPISLEEVSPGDEVVLSIQHDNFGSSVLEIHQNPSAIEEPGGEEPFWGMTQRMFDVDPELGIIRFAKDPFGVTVDTRFLDERGHPTDPESFEFGDPIVAQVDFRTGNLLILRREDPEVPLPHPDDPDIGVIYAAFGFIEDRVALLFDSFGFTFAIDAPILDEQTGEFLDADQLGNFAGEFVYVLVKHPQLGEAFPDLIVEIIVNPEDRPLGPGERPTPTEVFGSWEDIGVVGEVLPETQEILMAGIQVRVNGDTEVTNQNGFDITAADLRAGDLILINGQPRSDHSVEASHILVDPEFPPQGFELPLFTEIVLRIDGDVVHTQGGRWWFDENATFSDGVTDEELQQADFAPGDRVRYNISHTNVGDFVEELVRNPVSNEPLDEVWFQDGEVFAFDPELRRLLFVGPQFAIRNRTEAFDRLGRKISLSNIPPGVEVVIVEEPSFTGGPPVASSVEVFNPETIYDGPDLAFVTFAGIDGDLIVTTDFPRFVAVDADLSFGSGDPAQLSDLVRGARIRAVINHPPPGLYSPFGDVVGAVTIDPDFEGPLATGEVHGLAFTVDETARVLTLEGEEMAFGAGIEIVGLELEPLLPEQLLPGDLLAVNFFPALDGLRATKIRLVDPLRIPDLRDDLLVAPLLHLDTVDGLLFLQGAEFLVPEASEIFGPDGSQIPLGSIQPGDFVWITAIEEGGLAVAQRVEVAEGFEGPLFAGGGLEILSVFPQPGEVGVPTEETFEVEFNELVGLLSDVDEDFGIGFWPLPEAPVDIGISGDGRTLVANVSLLDDTVYQLFVTSERFGLFTMTVTTGDFLPEGAIRGRVDVPAEVPVEVIAAEESGVLLIDATADLEDGVADQDVIMIAPFTDTGEYHFENVPDGSYVLYAELVLEFGFDDQLVLDAFHLGEDGQPVVVEIQGDMVEGVDLTVLPPDPFAIDDTAPANGATDLALENEFSVTFSEQIGLDADGRPKVNGVIRPLPPSGRYRREDLVVSEDGLTVSLPVSLEANTTYSFALRDAISSSGLNLEGHQVVVATTGTQLPVGAISGRLALPSGTPPDRVIRTPATILLVPSADFDPLDPDVGQAAVAATLSSDGTYSFANAAAGSHAVLASVDVALPGDFRLKIGEVDSDFAAFAALGIFGREAPADYRNFSFIGFAEDVAADVADVDFLLRPEDVRRGGLRVTGVQPDGETLANAPTELELEIGFSEPVDLNGFVASLDPLPPSGDILANFAIENGGRRLRFTEIELALATIYTFSVTSARALDTDAVLPEPFRLVIKTEGAGDLALGSVSGSISLEGDEISEAAVLLLDPTADFVRIIGGALVSSDGSYNIGNLAPGEYGLLLEAKTVNGRDLLEAYDPEADGTANNIQVEESELVDVDFSLAVASLPDQGANGDASASLDLDSSAGDQGIRNIQVEAGETVQVEIYADGLVDAASYSVSVGFDPAQLEFSRVSPGGAGVNLLAATQALVRFDPPALSASGLQFSGAVVSASNATVASGGGLLGVVEFTTLEAYTSSTISLNEVSFVDVAGGRNILQPDANVFVAEPLNLFDLPKGPLSFDFNPSSGDDELFHLGNVRPGEEFSVEVFANDVTNQINYSIKVAYDPMQLTYISFSAAGFLGSGGGNAFALPPLLTESTVEFGSAILGAVEAQAVTGSGSMGSLTFSTTDTFTETDLVIVEYSIGEFGAPQESVEASIFARVSQESLGGESQTNADFDGDGTVGFQDFFGLAAVFGSRVTPEIAIYDLDLDGFIGFGDLFRFSDNFGRVVAKAAADYLLPQIPGRLRLTAESKVDGMDVILGSEDLSLSGYGVVVDYDESAFRLRRVVDVNSILRRSGNEPLLLTLEEEGRVTVAGSVVGSSHDVADGRLATLQFEPLFPDAEGDFVIHEAVLHLGDGVMAQPQELGRVRAGWAPQAFVLQQNYPNPFNPSTTIRYQLADAAPVRLQIFDSLGQQVRSLVSERQTAGYYRVVWDSRNDSGSQVAAGVYFYRLEAGDFSRVNKLLLLK